MVHLLERRAEHGTDLTRLLDRCVASHVITGSQAAAIAAAARSSGLPLSPTSDSGRRALAFEALGYVGGVVLVVGAMLIANLYWSDLGLAARLTAVALGAVVLLGAGGAVPQREGAGQRLRGVLWVAGSIAVAGFLQLLGEGALDLTVDWSMVLATAGGTATAALLWQRHRHVLLQFATMLGLMAAVASLAAAGTDAERLPALLVWAVGLGWLLLARLGGVGSAQLASAAGAASAIVASTASLDLGWGVTLGLLTLTGVMVLAVASADLTLLAVGAAGTLVVLPATITIWFPDSEAMPFVLFGTGVALIAVALVTFRRRSS